jgi:hypothetical protein
MSTMSWINEGNEGCGVFVIIVLVVLTFLTIALGPFVYNNSTISTEEYTQLKARIDAHKDSNPTGYEKVKVRVSDALHDGVISRGEFSAINDLIETNDRRSQFGVEIQ